jgi:hypothetical protein
MGVISTQGINFQLVAGDNNVILDLFKDEDILLSDNVTGLFDLGTLPSDFTRQITLPGTKKNNAFFEHVYDISVFSPDLFATNQKVPCYLDFGGIYLAQGYLQLNRVNILANKFIDSYEVSIYGALSSFAREINRSYLTDMTASLAQFDHTASFGNITSSWDGNLFSGSIIYPMAEYGQKLIYSPQTTLGGIDSPSGSLFVQDYKPAIRIKEVWDAIFEEYGYTYSGSFWEQAFLNNVYMVLNNKLRYPIFSEFDLETYGQFKIGPISGSTDTILSGSTLFSQSLLPWYAIQSNPGGNISQDLTYTLDYDTKLRGFFNLTFEVSGSNNTSAVPQFSLVTKNTSGVVVDKTPLPQVNDFMRAVQGANSSQGLSTAKEKYTVLSEFNTSYISSGSYNFFLEYSQLGTGPMTAIIDPQGALTSYLQITKVGNVGEGKSISVGANMPFGTKGIKKIDFLTSVQKKFNLVIYPSKIKRNEFIVESFPKWYREGIQWDFNQFANLNEKIEVIPANNLAVNELNFGDTLDQDYISQQFAKEANREFGKTYYVDTQNFFSQGNFEVKTGLASSPIIYLQGTGVSGSRVLPDYRVSVEDEQIRTFASTCTFGPASDTLVNKTTGTLLDANGNVVVNYGPPIVVQLGFETVECNTGPFPFTASLSIPYGATNGTYIYQRFAEVNGNFECCNDEQELICVLSVTNASLTGSSPISAC